MKVVITYKKKGDKPVLSFASNNNQEALDFLNDNKDKYFCTEIWTLGMRQKAYYGKPIEEPVKKATKKTPKKKVVAKKD
tara:strand:- start:214 stop:450 length:237 start_codon:yes stop_codon:yes gene_type:complete